MSTRGILGVRVSGIDKLTYNHSDSYPSYLGNNVVQFCRELSRQKTGQLVLVYRANDCDTAANAGWGKAVEEQLAADIRTELLV